MHAGRNHQIRALAGFYSWCFKMEVNTLVEVFTAAMDCLISINKDSLEGDAFGSEYLAQVGAGAHLTISSCYSNIKVMDYFVVALYMNLNKTSSALLGVSSHLFNRESTVF